MTSSNKPQDNEQINFDPKHFPTLIAKPANAPENPDVLTWSIDDGTLGDDRSGGASDSSGYPPDIFLVFKDKSFSPLIENLSDEGFKDARAPITPYVFERVTYYHLRPYLYKVKAAMTDNPSVMMAHDLLTFDRRFCSTILKYIGIFELEFRAQYSHLMKELHGEYALYDNSLFSKQDRYDESFARYKGEVKRCKDRYVKTVMKDNNDLLPIELGVEYITMGNLSCFYSNTADKEVSAPIANFFKSTKREFTSWLNSITAVRNICAHFEPYITRKSIPSAPLSIRDIDYNAREPFYIALLISRVLSPVLPFVTPTLSYSFRLYEDLSEIIERTRQYSPAILTMAGIPDNWEELLNEASNETNAFYKTFAHLVPKL